MELFKLCFVFIVMPLAKCSPPGTFFWKPRLDLRLGEGGSQKSKYTLFNLSALSHSWAKVPLPFRYNAPPQQMPTVQNVMNGKVVLIRSFECSMAILMLADGLADREPFAHLDPLRGYFYTNAYRWAQRHFSLIPQWLAADELNYYQTHKVWKKRFMYMNTFMPKWMTYLIPYVPQSEWAQERREYRRFERFAEEVFAKHFRFPSKKFNDFKSQEESPSISSSSSSKTFNSKSVSKSS